MSITKTFAKLGKELLHEAATAFNVKALKSAKKESIGELITEKAESKGANQLLSSLEKETLKTMVEALGETVEHNSKVKLQQSLQAFLKDKGTEETIKKQTVDSLKECIKSLSATPKATKQAELVEELQDQLQIAGLTEMLGLMTKPFITEVLEELKLKKSGNKESGIKRIVNDAFPDLVELEEDNDEEKEDKKKSEKKSGEKKSGEKTKKSSEKKSTEEKKERPPVPPLKKGITHDQIFQAYYQTELKDYCKKEGLLTAGSKQVLIKRILAYLGGDTTTTKPGYKKEAKKRKATEISEQKAKKAKTK
jgi:hypothetical protein